MSISLDLQRSLQNLKPRNDLNSPLPGATSSRVDGPDCGSMFLWPVVSPGYYSEM
jgi:hypothetical protein